MIELTSDFTLGFAIGFCTCAVMAGVLMVSSLRYLHMRMIQKFEASLSWGEILDCALKNGRLHKEHGHIKVPKKEDPA